MRNVIKEFVSICARHLPVSEPIYEFGSFQVPGQDDRSNLRVHFPGKKYIGADMRQGPGVDVILDLHHIELPSESVGSVLLLETIEHVEYPRKAIDEVYRILKPKGILIMSSQMYCPIHDFPHDYWRFTPEAFKSLLKPFSQVTVTAAGQSLFPHTVIGIGSKGPVNEIDLSAFHQELAAWKQYWTDASRPKGFKRFLKFLSRQDDKVTNAFHKWKKLF